MAWWERKRYRGNKVWVRVDDAGDPVLDDRGLAALRYKPDDERTYSVRTGEVAPLETPEPRVPDASPPENAGGTGNPDSRTAGSGRKSSWTPPPAPEDAIRIYTDGASSGNPGPAGLGAVLAWRGREREIHRFLGETTNNVAELSAVLDALRAVTRPTLPVRVYTDSTYVIGVLTEGHKVRANQPLVAEIREEMARFPDLELIKVPAHAGIPGNERADALARKAIAGAS